MRIAVAGGTGFVGNALVNELVKCGHEIIILSRTKKAGQSKQICYVTWLTEEADSLDQLQDIDIFINLAGESINSGRWTSDRKKTIVNSRIKAVDEIMTLMAHLTKKPKAFINASAIGFYGTSEEMRFTEEDDSIGRDFLTSTVITWESEANEATKLGVRTVLCRFGIILDKNKGALPKIAAPYKAFAGGNLGNGSQWMSWIHLEDVIRGILFVIENEKICGPVNFTAPQPVKMNEFGKTLANVLHRPHWLTVPGWMLKLILGEMSMLVLEGQMVMPKKLLENGFQFKYTQLESALKNIFPST